jgi:hypothetical protein
MLRFYVIVLFFCPIGVNQNHVFFLIGSVAVLTMEKKKVARKGSQPTLPASQQNPQEQTNCQK